MENNIKITVEVSINETIERVWECWTCANDIINWNTASDDWHTIKAENVLIEGGKFNYGRKQKMEVLALIFGEFMMKLYKINLL